MERAAGALGPAPTTAEGPAAAVGQAVAMPAAKDPVAVGEGPMAGGEGPWHTHDLKV